VHQLKITLKWIRPPIWRRVLVGSDISLGELHTVIQHAMGWSDYHLHDFRVGKVEYGPPEVEPDPFFGRGPKDEDQAILSRVARSPKSKILYTYDFGDTWEHEILVEKVIPADESVRYPVCIAGKRHCPPEDCGGPHGYGNLLEARQDPDHPDYEMYSEWIDGSFNPEEFDLKAVNRRLAGRPR
jgi:hypothetical protein